MMGFLTGAYLKIASARMRIRLQHELASITQQHDRVLRNIEKQEKLLTSQQRSADVALRRQTQASIFGAAEKGKFDPSDPQSLANADSNTLQLFSAYQQEAQYRYAQAQSVWADYFESFKEQQLEPLKAQEEMLAIRKSSIESRLKLIEGQEEAARNMEKSSQKDFVPEYTGQG